MRLDVISAVVLIGKQFQCTGQDYPLFVPSIVKYRVMVSGIIFRSNVLSSNTKYYLILGWNKQFTVFELKSVKLHENLFELHVI
jgi:hypothetical protein